MAWYSAANPVSTLKSTVGTSGKALNQLAHGKTGEAVKSMKEDYQTDDLAHSGARKVADVMTLGGAAAYDPDVTNAAERLSKSYSKNVTDKTTATARNIDKGWIKAKNALMGYINGNPSGSPVVSPFGAGAGGLNGTGIYAPTVANVPGYKAAQIGAVQGPQAAALAGMASNPYATYQANLASQLAQQASGNGPSLAQMQGNHALAQNQALAASQLASTRGAANNPFAARASMLAANQNAAGINQNIAMNRLQEQQMAQTGLANLAGGARGQDIQIANANAGFQQQANLAKYQGDLQKAVAQGQMDQQTANQMFAEANQNARANAAGGLDAQKAAAMAAIDSQKNGMLQQQAAASRAGGLASAAGGLFQGLLGMFTGDKGDQAQAAPDASAQASDGSNLMGGSTAGTQPGGYSSPYNYSTPNNYVDQSAQNPNYGGLYKPYGS